jgi:hypothetical protein
MENLELYNKIEAYLKGELSAEAAQAFELEMAENTDLQEQVDLHRLEWDAMEVLVENDLRSKMATWGSQQLAVSPPSVQEAKVVNLDTSFQPMTATRGGKFTRFAWAAAASIAILATVALWFFNRPTEPKGNDTVRNEQPSTPTPSPADTVDETMLGSGLPPDSTTQKPDSAQQKRDSMPRR